MRTLDIPQANNIAYLLTALTVLGEETANPAQIAEAVGDLDSRFGPVNEAV
jgi:hypothetical protein